MFRKPKRKVKESLRRKDDVVEDAPDGAAKEEADSTTELVLEARKRLKQGNAVDESDAKAKETQKPVLHTFSTGGNNQTSNADLATSTAMHHPDSSDKGGTAAVTAGRGQDGVYREGRNKFWAGPIKAASNVRVTARFDYQPDICKDYKETGFCGFGDTCIYLHDRGDQLSGWQLEEKWQEEQRLKKEQQEKELNDFLEKASGGKSASSADKGSIAAADDGLPFACHICRMAFTDPVVTACQHYFCEKCIMDHVRNESDSCPVCNKETHRVFNEPTKLISKKKQVLGAREAKQEGSWQLFFDTLSQK